MTAATETTHSPWCPDRDHVEDDEVHFYTAVWDLYEQRTGRTPIVSATAVRAAAILLTALEEAPEEDDTEWPRFQRQNDPGHHASAGVVSSEEAPSQNGATSVRPRPRQNTVGHKP